MNDPAARRTAAADRARLLLADVALLRTPPRLEAARDLYLELNIEGSGPDTRAEGGLKAGEMEERLGNADAARREYEQVIADYPGTAAAVAAAEFLQDLPAPPAAR